MEASALLPDRRTAGCRAVAEPGPCVQLGSVRRRPLDHDQDERAAERVAAVSDRLARLGRQVARRAGRDIAPFARRDERARPVAWLIGILDAGLPEAVTRPGGDAMGSERREVRRQEVRLAGE